MGEFAAGPVFTWGVGLLSHRLQADLVELASSKKVWD